MLWGAFNNATLGMMTMSHSMGTISQNIANVNTTGYKAKDTLFQTVLSESNHSVGQGDKTSIYSPGANGLSVFGVKPADRYLITKQGQVTSTSNWSDLAINGRGFFMVSQPDSNGDPQASGTSGGDTLYTRAGDFTQKAVGTKSYFTTSSGQYLLGWMADANGYVAGQTTTANSGTGASSGTSTLGPIYIEPGQTINGVATSSMVPQMNLPSNATLTTSPQSFTNTSLVTDGTGAAQDLTMTWTRVDGDNWTVDFSLPTNPTSGSVGTITGSPVTVTMDRFGNITSPDTSASGKGFADLAIDWSTGATTSSSVSADLNSQKPTISDVETTVTVYDQAYNAENLILGFEHTANGEWYARIKNPAASGSVVSVNGSTGGSVKVTFDGAGKILTPKTLTFGYAWTPSVTNTTPATVAIPTVLSSYASDLQSAIATVTQPSMPADAATLATYKTDLETALGAVSVSSPATSDDLLAYADSYYTAFETANTTTATAKAAAAAAAGTNTITVDMSKVTQYSQTSATSPEIKTIDQNGYASGVMNTVSFTSTGELIANFSNGRTRTLAMVPVASFTAADSLNPVSGTLFSRTQEAGEMTIGSIASQGSGNSFTPGAVEASNVDLGDEFSRMITTQKAYSSNAQVFKTADEMVTTARDLYR